MHNLSAYEISKWKNRDVKKTGRHIYRELQAKKKYNAWNEHVEWKS